MSDMDQRLLDLLADEATGNLSEEDARELAELTAGLNTDAESQSLELTAAAILLAETEIEPMPAHLEANIAGAAERYFSANEAEPQRTFELAPPRSKRSFLDWFGWAVAAAACIALVGVIYYNQQRVSELRAQLQELQRPTPVPPTPTMAQRRDQLVNEADDLARATWTKGNVKELEGVTGEVVWSDKKQMGYMTLRGLPPNDPNQEAYQLWIFEQADLEPYPKDGGVFTVDKTGEVIIPIEAKLKTVDPKAFAITIEKPGGVVVSERGRIAALAPVKPSRT